MKKIYSGAFLTLLMFLTSENAFAQNLCVYENEEIKHCLLLEEVQNLTFSEGQVYLKKTDGTVSDLSISDVRKIQLEEEGTNINTPVITGERITIFPNPVEEILTIASVDEVVKIHLFDMNGNLILQKEQTGQLIAVQLNTIPAGIYTLQIVTTNGNHIEKIKK